MSTKLTSIDITTVLKQIYGVSTQTGKPVLTSSLGVGVIGSDYQTSAEFQWLKVDSLGQIYIGGGSISPLANRGAFYTNQFPITTSGTPVHLAYLEIPNGFQILLKHRAKGAATGSYITVGTSSVNALNTSTSNYALAIGDILELAVTNLNLIWVDSTVNGEILEVVVEQ